MLSYILYSKNCTISVPDKSHALVVMQWIDEDMTTAFHTLIMLPEKRMFCRRLLYIKGNIGEARLKRDYQSRIFMQIIHLFYA